MFERMVEGIAEFTPRFSGAVWLEVFTLAGVLLVFTYLIVPAVCAILFAQGLTIAVAAGKGGTGKTLVATSLALALNSSRRGGVQLLDADLEEPNAHILLHPTIRHEEPVRIMVPAVAKTLCNYCGVCAELCQFSAIAVIRQAVVVFPELCSGCGACAYACPTGAISETERRVGTIVKGVTGEGVEFYQGRLNVGEQRAGPVTRQLKEYLSDSSINIVDAPPGTACPMQEGVEDSDYCVLVTEPTPFGLENLGMAVDTCRQMGIACGVIINGDGENYEGVEAYCLTEGLPVLLRIPQRREIAEAYSRGETLVVAFPECAGRLVQVYQRTSSHASERAGQE